MELEGLVGYGPDLLKVLGVNAITGEVKQGVRARIAELRADGRRWEAKTLDGLANRAFPLLPFLVAFGIAWGTDCGASFPDLAQKAGFLGLCAVYGKNLMRSSVQGR